MLTQGEVSSLGYPASDVDGIDLYEIPHLVIWPVELQQHCHSISSSKLQCICTSSTRKFSKAVWLGLQQSPLLGALSVQALCQHIQAICLLAMVHLLLVHHQPHCLAAPVSQHCTPPSVAEVTALPCSMLNKHALPLQMCLHLGLCCRAQLTFAATIRLEGEA